MFESSIEVHEMDRRRARWLAVMGAIVGALAGVASASGVFLRGELTTVPFTTVRGEQIEVVTDGVYRFNASPIVAEGIGWDIVTLMLVVPAMVIASLGMWRGSLRAALVAAGLLAYFTYQYFEYAVFWAFGPLYPLHLLIAALAVSTLALLVGNLDLKAVAARTAGHFPVHSVVTFSALVVVVLAGLWVPVILLTLGGDITDALQGATTLVVPVFDLGLLVPVAVFTGITVWRRMPLGYLLGIVLLTKGASMGLAIVAMLLVEWQVTGEEQLPPILVFAAVAAISLVVGWRAVSAVAPEARSTTAPPTAAIAAADA